MIKINTLKITDNLKNIIVSVSTDNSTERFEKVLLWKHSKFRKYPEAIDISNLLVKSTNTENFIITANSLKIDLFTGVYYIEFNSNARYDNQSLGVVANLFNYKECLLNQSVKIVIDNCGKAKNKCKDCEKDTYLVGTLLQSLEVALENSYLEEAAKIATELDKLCKTCGGCPPYKDTMLPLGKGMGYQMIDGNIKKDSDTPTCNPPLPQATNGFIPIYIKYLDDYQPQIGQSPCSIIDEKCYKDIAYLYLPNGTKNWDYNRNNLLYSKPIRSNENLVRPKSGSNRRYFVFQNALQNSIFTSSPESARNNDFAYIEFTDLGQRLRYLCCGCAQ